MHGGLMRIQICCSRVKERLSTYVGNGDAMVLYGRTSDSQLDRLAPSSNQYRPTPGPPLV